MNGISLNKAVGEAVDEKLLKTTFRLVLANQGVNLQQTPPESKRPEPEYTDAPDDGNLHVRVRKRKVSLNFND